MKRFYLILFLVLAGTMESFAQNLISGRILDDKTAEPLIGATISVKGTSKGTATDIEGKFTLSPKTEYPFTIVVNFVGYNKKEIDVYEEPLEPLSIKLRNRTLLDEIVVIGYGTQERKNLVSSVSKINVSEVKSTPVAGLDAQLQGKAAGVQINMNSGIPGDGVFVRVRGSTSINASNDPLYIVDGVFINNRSLSTVDLGGKQTSPIADINPADIESIEVLKDASAIAIYGSRGANGVVIITTKRGEYNTKPKVTIHTSQGWAQAQQNRLWKLATGPEHAELVNEQWINSGIDNPKLNQTSENRPFRPVSEGGRGLPEEQQTYDRVSDLFRVGRIQNYDLSLDGGTKDTKYYLGGSYTKQEANIRPVVYERASFKLNLDQKVNDKVQVGISNSISCSYRNQVRAGTGTGTGIFQAALHTPTYQPKNNPDGTPSRLSPFDNLQVLLENVDINTGSLRYIGNLYGDIEIIKGLKFRTSWSLDYNNYDENEYNNDKTLLGASTNGLANVAQTQNNAWINEQTLTYRKNFGRDHSFGALLGNTIQSNVFKINSAQGTGFPNNAYTQISSAATITATQSWTKSTLASFFSRVDYNYSSRYFLEFSLRADGSSRFGENNKWGYFPSVGIAWQAKEESFLQNFEFISDLKVRSSYGIIGNQNGIEDFAAMGLWTGGAGYPDNSTGGDRPGTAPLKLENSDLRWEKTRQLNAGIDLGLLKERVNLTLDFYHKYTTDLLLPVQTRSITGFTTYLSNTGEISNKGVEFSLNTKNIQTPDFTWSTNINISSNQSKIEKLPTPSVYGSRDMIRFEEGYPLYTFWLYNQLYVDPQTGDAVFEDVNGDGRITVADRKMMGNASPRHFGGITNSFTYKNFDLNIFFNYQYGSKVVSFDRILGEGGGTKDANRMILAYNIKRWQKPGDITDVPRATSVGNNYTIEQSSRFLEDASFLRLKSVTLGYTVPKSVTSKLKVDNFRLYLAASNLWLQTKYIGPDPESTHDSNPNARGIDVGTPPQPQVIQVGLNLTL